MNDEAARMIERLRTTQLLSNRNQMALQAEAADLIASQQAEIAALEAKLAAALKLLNWWRTGDDRAKSPNPVVDL